MKYYEINMSHEELNEPVAAYRTTKDIKSAVNDFIMRAREGLSFKYSLGLISDMNITLEELADLLHVSVRTLQRLDISRVLEVDHSVKILQLAALRKHGIEVFCDKDDFMKWMRSENVSLQNRTPFSYLDTTFGFDMIHQLLGRIEHGISA